jgi:hypothetical protein
VETSTGADGWHFLSARSGATARELVAAAAELPPCSLADAVLIDRSGSGVVLMFKGLPPGVVVDSAPWPSCRCREDLAQALTIPPAAVPPAAASAWVPAVGAEVGPDRGLTPFQFAVWELLSAAPDGAAGARLAQAVTRLLPPQTVIVLADLLRERRGQ